MTMGKGDAKKRRRKGAGRPRKPGPREPNGQPSRRCADVERVSHEQDARQTVWQARARQAGQPVDGPVSPTTARRMSRRGTLLDALHDDGRITDVQRRAGHEYAAARQRYRMTQGLPPDSATGSRWGEPRGAPGPEDVEAARLARERYRTLTAALDACGVAIRQAADRACVRDVSAPLHLLQIALTTLAEAAGIDSEK